jgi:hypothetical protein
MGFQESHNAICMFKKTKHPNGRDKTQTSICQVLNAIEEKLIAWENDTVVK